MSISDAAAESASSGKMRAEPVHTDQPSSAEEKPGRLTRWFRTRASTEATAPQTVPVSSDEEDEKMSRPEKWSLGILNDKVDDEVPGSVLLMSSPFKRNEPLGLRNTPARHSASSLPSPYLPRDNGQLVQYPSRSPGPRPGSAGSRPERPHSARPSLFRMFSGQSQRSVVPEMKKTTDGKIILEPQPEDSLNDPLNWPSWRRDVALLSLGFYCAMGGGMTPVLAAAFNDVSSTYGVPVPEVALTTGFYMLGLGLGSVIASPTAILFGKRPVYMVGAILFILSSIWCALSPNYPSLVVARIFMGLAVSPVECLPSATIAEIFYLHERAYRLGVYTLLLLGGKNLVPLVSAAIDGAMGWRWIFWVVACTAGLALVLLFFFVPETFWDRTPRARKHVRKHRLGSFSHLFRAEETHKKHEDVAKALSASIQLPSGNITLADVDTAGTIAQRRQKTMHHVGFADAQKQPGETVLTGTSETPQGPSQATTLQDGDLAQPEKKLATCSEPPASPEAKESDITAEKKKEHTATPSGTSQIPNSIPDVRTNVHDPEALFTPLGHSSGASTPTGSSLNHTYTQNLRHAPPKPYLETLKPWNGRLRRDNWFKVAIRPFILYAYPGILWSSLVYSLSIGWLIVLSESVSEIYRNKETYNFTALQAGLVYLSPFIAGILGTAVAGKVSDLIVRFMARRNNGIYEPEFRLVMALPILISTGIGLMGFGWSAQERDNYIVPTIFFGVISFGCSLGSTTAITFAVDSYRQYAGEALVTLNFSKNVFHGFVFSLFFPNWLEADGAKQVFVTIGGIQVACLLSTIPMYIYGKRARMWTVRKNMMERF